MHVDVKIEQNVLSVLGAGFGNFYGHLRDFHCVERCQYVVCRRMWRSQGR